MKIIKILFPSCPHFFCSRHQSLPGRLLSLPIHFPFFWHKRDKIFKLNIVPVSPSLSGSLFQLRRPFCWKFVSNVFARMLSLQNLPDPNRPLSPPPYFSLLTPDQSDILQTPGTPDCFLRGSRRDPSPNVPPPSGPFYLTAFLRVVIFLLRVLSLDALMKTRTTRTYLRAIGLGSPFPLDPFFPDVSSRIPSLNRPPSSVDASAIVWLPV